ncbi:MAG: hypothetical protein M5U34_18800 [Chloroflexi bacterium]|nr:hypothetical protein [Chloroflexota bacterium]
MTRPMAPVDVHLPNATAGGVVGMPVGVETGVDVAETRPVQLKVDLL